VAPDPLHSRSPLGQQQCTRTTYLHKSTGLGWNRIWALESWGYCTRLHVESHHTPDPRFPTKDLELAPTYDNLILGARISRIWASKSLLGSSLPDIRFFVCQSYFGVPGLGEMFWYVHHLFSRYGRPRNRERRPSCVMERVQEVWRHPPSRFYSTVKIPQISPEEN